MDSHKNGTGEYEKPDAFGIVMEFLRAFKNPYTYNVLKNRYIVFGLLWGIPIPCFSLWIHARVLGLVPSLMVFSDILNADPIHYIFILHPLIFALVFGAIGTTKYESQLFIQEINRVLRLQSVQDPLTKVYNRRYFDERLKVEITRARRYQRPLSLLIIDLDSLKKINDLHGHILGDVVLVEVARALRKNVRRVDSLCRYGGDEFAVIMPETVGANAVDKAEELVQKVREIDFSKIDRINHNLVVSISIGVSCYSQDVQNEYELISRADEALYSAKRKGGDNAQGYKLKDRSCVGGRFLIL